MERIFKVDKLRFFVLHKTTFFTNSFKTTLSHKRTLYMTAAVFQLVLISVQK